MAALQHLSKAGFVCVTILAVSLCVPARAAEFAGGTGEPDDPYQIATASQLLSLGADPNLQSKHFILVADIDLDPNLPGGGLLENGLTLTTGSLDGCGHRILNLGGRIAIEETRRDGTVYYRDRYGSSLFELIGADAVVRNLCLEGVILRGPAMLVGENRGLIMDCSAEGSLSGDLSGGSSDGSAGGLARENTGIIIGCRVAASILGPDTGRPQRTGAGGIAFENTGRILNCAVDGNVVGAPGAGLVTSNSGTIMYSRSTCSVSGGSGLVQTNSGTIVACYATGDVTDGPAGGLVGTNSGTIRWCCATGDVSTTDEVAGGLVGANAGTISECYATGNVRAEEDAGGLVGSNTGTVTQCYATGSGGAALAAESFQGNVLNCYALSSSDGGGTNNGYAIQLTDEQMREQVNFVGWDFAGTSLDGSLDDWIMPEGGGCPLLAAIDASEYVGSGTPDDPYLVETPCQFMAISGGPQACYRLETDIDLAGQVFSRSIIPIFCGHLDGDGHNVSNLTLTGKEDVGLFEMVYPEATVVGLHLCDVYIETTGGTQERIAALAARNRGTVTDCTATVAMRIRGNGSTSHVAGLIGVNEGGDVHRCSAHLAFADWRGLPRDSGGLVGYNAGTISQCHVSTFTNNTLDRFGGLVGCNDGSITDCYAQGYIQGAFWGRQPSQHILGGLVGLNNAIVRRCYTSAIVVRASGGLVGENREGIAADSYFLVEGDGGGPDNGVGVALSDAAMRQQASFVGWDFDDVWVIDEGMDYPRLRWEGVACEQ